MLSKSKNPFFIAVSHPQAAKLSKKAHAAWAHCALALWLWSNFLYKLNTIFAHKPQLAMLKSPLLVIFLFRAHFFVDFNNQPKIFQQLSFAVSQLFTGATSIRVQMYQTRNSTMQQIIRPTELNFKPKVLKKDEKRWCTPSATHCRHRRAPPYINGLKSQNHSDTLRVRTTPLCNVHLSTYTPRCCGRLTMSVLLRAFNVRPAASRSSTRATFRLRLIDTGVIFSKIASSASTSSTPDVCVAIV